METKTQSPRPFGRFATATDAAKWYFGPTCVREPRPEPLRPLFNRCECGARISDSKLACKACVDAELQRTASLITTQEAFEVFLAQFQPEERAEVVASLKPYMDIALPDEVVESDESVEASEAVLAARSQDATETR